MDLRTVLILATGAGKKIRRRAPNLKIKSGQPDHTLEQNYERSGKNRYTGPYSTIPFDYYIQSPVGLVPKDGGNDTRLIFHLSYPHNGHVDSVNAARPKEMCTVHYLDFSEAIAACLQLGIGCKISKPDMSSAFRNLPMKRRCWKY